MKKILIIFFAVAILLLMVAFFMRMLSPEDNWFFNYGNWQKHSNPSSSAPTETCN